MFYGGEILSFFSKKNGEKCFFCVNSAKFSNMKKQKEKKISWYYI
jgi:hypothetical protein